MLRFVEKMQLSLLNQAEAIIKATLQVITLVESGSPQNHLITYDDLLFLYTIVGLFASQKKLDHESRRSLVTRVMDSLIQRLG